MNLGLKLILIFMYSKHSNIVCNFIFKFIILKPQTYRVSLLINWCAILLLNPGYGFESHPACHKSFLKNSFDRRVAQWQSKETYPEIVYSTKDKWYSKLCMYSSMVEHMNDNHDVAGSNPATNFGGER